MNHKFIPSAGLDHTKCGVPGCGYNALDHLPGECESCSNIGIREPLNNMLLCRDCIEKEKLTLALEVPERLADEVFDSKSVARTAESMVRELDTTIPTRKDLYNAKVPTMQELKAVINADITITNKNYEIARVMVQQFKHFQNIIFTHQEIVVNAANSLKIIQQEMNDIASKLRSEERANLRIQDINYRPTAPKYQPTDSKRKILKPKINKDEVRQIAAVINMPEFMIQSWCLANNVTPIVAAEQLTKLKNETKAKMEQKKVN